MHHECPPDPEATAASDRQIVIVSHSKGCLDVLVAPQRPGASAISSRWVAIQGPFRGTPVADVVPTAPVLRGLGHRARAAGGSIDSRTTRGRGPDASTSPRTGPRSPKCFRESRRCGSRALTPAQLTATFLVPTLALIAATSGEPNDGRVPVRSARLGGARLVEIDGVDQRDARHAVAR